MITYFFGGALHITCWAGVSYGSKIIQNKLIVWDVDCGGLIVWDVEAPEQKNVRLRLMQHVVNPPEEEGVNSTL